MIVEILFHNAEKYPCIYQFFAEVSKPHQHIQFFKMKKLIERICPFGCPSAHFNW